MKSSSASKILRSVPTEITFIPLSSEEGTLSWDEDDSSHHSELHDSEHTICSRDSYLSELMACPDRQRQQRRLTASSQLSDQRPAISHVCSPSMRSLPAMGSHVEPRGMVRRETISSCERSSSMPLTMPVRKSLCDSPSVEYNNTQGKRPSFSGKIDSVSMPLVMPVRRASRDSLYVPPKRRQNRKKATRAERVSPVPLKKRLAT
eukprot:scaffold18498_cov117-Cylindrotheca_fusiformis.AAC.3